MSYFKAKMHQIRFRLLGELTLQRSPRLLGGFKGHTSKGKEGRKGGREGKKRA